MLSFIDLEIDALIHDLEVESTEIATAISGLLALETQFPDFKPVLDALILKFQTRDGKIAGLILGLQALKKKPDDGTLAFRLRFYRILNGKKEEIKNMFHKVTDAIEFELVAEDKFGNAAQVEAGKTKLSAPGADDLGAFEENPADGVLPKWIPNGKIGVIPKFQAEADADLGEGEKLIRGESEEVTLIAGDAEVLKLQIK